MSERMTDEQVALLERRAKAALRGDPPELLAGDEAGRYRLVAREEVLDFIREVGPLEVLRLVREVRQQREEYAHLLNRLRNVETWSVEK